MTDFRQDARLIDQIIKRLEERQQLWNLARDVYSGIRQVAPLHTPFAGEKDVTGAGLCANPGGEGRFDCTKMDFACAKFTCDANFAFSDCNGAKTNFSCSSDNNFSCTSPAGNKEFYDCQEFSCAPNAGGSFQCDTKFDFFCGDEFVCSTDFDCTGGHVFDCTDDHECKDSFECKAGGTKCDNNFPYQADEGDMTPGDFECGWEGNDADTFGCTDTFSCNAQDQFECEKTTKFDCGNDKGDSFTCSKETAFDCETTFNCFDAKNQFSCVMTFTPPPPLPDP